MTFMKRLTKNQLQDVLSSVSREMPARFAGADLAEKKQCVPRLIQKKRTCSLQWKTN